MAKQTIPTLMLSYQAASYGMGEAIQAKAAELPQFKDNQVLIQVKASSVTRGDLIIRRGKPYVARLFTGLLKPKNPILGFEYAGIVIALGEGVKDFRIGDRVMGCFDDKPGAYAQYLSADASSINKIPDSLSFESAAVSQMGALTALWFLNQAGIDYGSNVMVIGASGSVGSAALQIAKAKGAKVTAVCNKEAIHSLETFEADKYLARGEWKAENFVNQFDVVFDASGKYSLQEASVMLRQFGAFTTTNLMVSPFLKNRLLKEKGIRSYAGRMKITRANQQVLLRLLSNRQFRPLIDRCFEAEQLPQAHNYVEQGGKIGNLPIRF